jgi:MOSC domain-containing protein YiiM
VKAPAAGAMLRFDGFEGDGVADRRHHGGPDRTACVYPAAHYAWWSAVHGFELQFGAFSENLTVDGAREEEICIGDIVRIGGALAQVTLPRDPCPTIDRITDIPSLHRLARECGKCGFHMRTLEEGLVRAGDSFELVERHRAGISVAAVLDLYHGRSADRALQQKLLRMPEFADEGKRELTRRLG